MINPQAAEAAYLFVCCPIFLTGGIAGSIEGGTIPIISLLNPGSFPQGITGGGSPSLNLENAFAHFAPLPGASLQNYEFGRYPFANQVTAANAIITEPTNISLMMISPPRGNGNNIANRMSVMTALKQTLEAHALAGGTYTVVTISYTWEDALLRRLSDASDATHEIPQWRWQWDFEKPLINLSDANNVAQRYNNLMGRMASGQVVQPNSDGSVTWSGTAPTIGNPGSGAAFSGVPANQAAPTIGSSPSTGGGGLTTGVGLFVNTDFIVRSGGT